MTILLLSKAAWSGVGHFRLLDSALNKLRKEVKNKYALNLTKYFFHKKYCDENLLSHNLFSLILKSSKTSKISLSWNGPSYIPSDSYMFPTHHFSFKVNIATLFTYIGLTHIQNLKIILIFFKTF